ncbi:MAG: hypothetical protein ABIP06_08225 [Pyrinomonadaceae bacterium]
MKKFIIFLFTYVFFTLSLFAQNAPTGFDLSNFGVRIEPDKRLIAVLAALEAAETKSANGENVKVLKINLSDAGEAFRRELQSGSAGVSEDLHLKLGTFVAQYKKRNPAKSDSEILSIFLSMAYTLSPVPDLAEPLRTTNLPGDLLDVLDFSPLVREFYRSARLGEKIDGYTKEYIAAGDAMRPSAGFMVREILDYLHTRPQTTYTEKIKTEREVGKSKKRKIANTETVEHERRFFIVPEMLAPKGTINFRNVGDDYYAIVPPGTDLSESEVRRAFIQFVVDPLILANAKEITGFRESIKNLLDDRRKEKNDLSPDIFLAVSRSLVAAIDAKENEYRKVQIATFEARRKIDSVQGVEEKKKVSALLNKYKENLANETALRLSEAYENGGVLAFYFARQLNGLADSGFDIEGSLRDIILSLDATAETNRLAENSTARKRAVEARNAARVKALVVVENPVMKKLGEVETLIKSKNYSQAETDLKLLMRENPDEQPRIYYALGRVASLSAENIVDEKTRNNRLIDAKLFYENVLRTQSEKTDRALISLSYVALGRIHEFFGETEYAIKIYEQAIKIGNYPDSGYSAAVAARERLIKENQ